MGIKVLLADDSNAIKKVVQLCLQDFGVDLKTCGNGKDVLEVARQFQPDIALIDVMLPHRPGYDVAGDLKKDAALAKTPVVMLWSSFMEFDEAKFKASGAEDKLEKPFEADELRALIKKYVGKTQTQPLSSFVTLPKLDFQMQKPVAPVKEPAKEEAKEAWNMSSFEDISSFAQKIESEKEKIISPAVQVVEPVAAPTPQEPDSDWVRKDLGKFQFNLDEVDENTVSFQIDESKINDMSFIMKAEVGGAHGEGDQKEHPAATITAEEVAASAPEIPEPTKVEAVRVEVPIAPKPAATTPAPTPPATPAPAAKVESVKPSWSPAASTASLSSEELQKVFEKQISEFLQKEGKEIFAKAIAKVVPELATQLIKDEIERLTSN